MRVDSTTPRQGGIEQRCGRRDRGEALVHRRVRPRQRRLQRSRDLRGEQPVEHGVVARPEIGEVEPVALQKPHGRAVDDGRARPRKDDRHRNAEPLVDAAKLAQVGELVRTADVGGGGEQRILHEGSQQDVRAEARRVGVDLAQQVVGGDHALAHRESRRRHPDGLPRLVEAEQRHAFGLRLDLRVVAGGHERRARRRGLARGLARRPQLVREERSHEGFRGGIGCVEHDEPGGAGQPVEPAGERFHESRALGVRGAEPGEHLVRELGRRQELAEGGRGIAHVARQADGGRRGAARRIEVEPDRARVEIGVEERAVPNLVEVVVLRVHPENGYDGRIVLACEALGETDAGQRLEQRVQRTAEEAGLLSGHHGHGSRLRKAPRRRLRRRGRRPRSELRGQHVRDGGPRGTATAALDGSRPRFRRGRRAGVEGGQPLERVTVVAHESTRPRQSSKVDGHTRRGGAGGRHVGGHAQRTLANAGLHCQGPAGPSPVRPTH